MHIHKKYLCVMSSKVLVLNDILYEYILSVVPGYPEVIGGCVTKTCRIYCRVKAACLCPATGERLLAGQQFVKYLGVALIVIQCFLLHGQV